MHSYDPINSPSSGNRTRSCPNAPRSCSRHTSTSTTLPSADLHVHEPTTTIAHRHSSPQPSVTEPLPLLPAVLRHVRLRAARAAGGSGAGGIPEPAIERKPQHADSLISARTIGAPATQARRLSRSSACGALQRREAPSRLRVRSVGRQFRRRVRRAQATAGP